jgi:hypothetical protein
MANPPLDQVKCVNNLTLDQLNRVFDQIQDGDLQVYMEFEGDIPDYANDMIGAVVALKNTSVELEVTIDLDVHHRFISSSTFEFWDRNGKFCLVQLEPVVRK